MAQNRPAAELLTSIAQRSDFIGCVMAGDGPTSKQTLCSNSGLARSTVNEVIRDLCEAGLLESASDGVVPTLFATLVWDEYESFTQHIVSIGASTSDTTQLWPTKTDRHEVIQLIAARIDILECARTPHDKRDLVAELSISRSRWTVRSVS